MNIGRNCPMPKHIIKIATIFHMPKNNNNNKSSVCFRLTLNLNMDAEFSMVKVKCDSTKIINCVKQKKIVTLLLFLSLKYLKF